VHGVVDSGRTMGTISTISFALAGASAAVAIYGFLSHREPEPPKGAWVRPVVGPQSFGLVGVF
jgi:hypothetical protein